MIGRCKTLYETGAHLEDAKENMSLFTWIVIKILFFDIRSKALVEIFDLYYFYARDFLSNKNTIKQDRGCIFCYV